MIEPCLFNNKICPRNNLKCETCKLDSQKEVIDMIETRELRIRQIKEDNIRRQLPARCRKCRHLEIISLDNKRVYCPYMIKDCLIK